MCETHQGSSESGYARQSAREPACEQTDKRESLSYPILAIVILTLAVSPFEVTLAGARVTAAKIAIIAVFLYWLATNRHRLLAAVARVRHIAIPSAIVILGSVVSWTAATDLAAAVTETIQLCLVLVCLVVPFADSIRTTASAKRVLWGAIAALGVAAAIALTTYRPMPMARIAGFDGHPNTLGAQMSLAVPALAVLATAPRRALQRIAELLLLCLMSVALLLTFSRAGMIAAVLAAMLAVIMLPIRSGIKSSASGYLAIALILAAISFTVVDVAVVPDGYGTLSRMKPDESWSGTEVFEPMVVKLTSGLAFTVNDGSTIERIELLKTALRMFRSHPVTGVGGDNYVTRLPEYWDAPIPWDSPTPPYRLAHWTIAQMAAEYGILGLVGTLWLLFAALYYPFIGYLKSKDPDRHRVLLSLTCGSTGLIASAMLGHLFSSGLEEFFGVFAAVGVGLAISVAASPATSPATNPATSLATDPSASLATGASALQPSGEARDQ